MSPPQKKGARDMANGAVLQCMEAATLGMPFEVWKTRMGRFRNESTVEAFKQVYRKGGIGSFWQGCSAKMVESASKGAILLYSKEAILTSMAQLGVSPTMAGFAAGAGGGVCQTVVMGPCTFLVTAAVTSEGPKTSITKKIGEVWKSKGIRGFYPGGSAIAFRQATNWASRQGFTEAVRSQLKKRNHAGEATPQLTVAEEALSGTIGGMLSTWNQPFEVSRITMQAAANEGKPKVGLVGVMRDIVKTDGVGGLFRGIIPRIGLGVWQTLFMVTGAKLVQTHLFGIKEV